MGNRMNMLTEALRRVRAVVRNAESLGNNEIHRYAASKVGNIS